LERLDVVRLQLKQRSLRDQHLRISGSHALIIRLVQFVSLPGAEIERSPWNDHLFHRLGNQLKDLKAVVQVEWQILNVGSLD
jgi:hypothetical protein